MKTTTTIPNIAIIPCLRYKNAPAAIEWLCKNFGFEENLVVQGENNTIANAQLTFGGGMIMLGSEPSHSAGGEVNEGKGDAGKQSIYIVVADADAIHKRVKKAGAEIVLKLEDKNYGGRGFSCKDPEGFVWHFGTYIP